MLCFHCHAIKNRIANHSIQKVQNLENERRWVYKKLRQESGLCDISYARYSEKRFTQICKALVFLFRGRKYGRLKPTETSVFEFSYKCLKSTLDELIKIYYLMFILRKGMSIEFFNEYIYGMVHPYWACYLMDPSGRRSTINTAKWI